MKPQSDNEKLDLIRVLLLSCQQKCKESPYHSDTIMTTTLKQIQSIIEN